jgi:hypothetical protein
VRLKLRDITPAPFRALDPRYHSFAVIRDAERIGTILFYRGATWGDAPDRWKAFLQSPVAFKRGVNRQPVLARFFSADRDGLLPLIRAHLENNDG